MEKDSYIRSDANRNAGIQVKNIRIGLVLGGGGARGLAHIGVLKVLQNAGIIPDVICGSSMGAFVGAIFAQKPDAIELERKVLEFISGPGFSVLGVNNFRQKKQRDPDDILSQMTRRVQRRLVLNLAVNRIALLKSKRLRFAVESLLDNDLIENTSIPFACTATDLISGQDIVFDKGPIRFAVESSSAIPGFIPPIKWDGKLLIDGSVANNFPVETARALGANYIIVIDVSLDFESAKGVRNVIDLVMRSSRITSNKLNTLLKTQADSIIRPQVGQIHWSEFTRIDEIITAGEKSAEEALTQIKMAIENRKFPLQKYFTRQKSSGPRNEKV